MRSPNLSLGIESLITVTVTILVLPRRRLLALEPFPSADAARSPLEQE
jgi:hypothetical protein